MGKVTNLDDYRNTTKAERRAKNTRDVLIQRFLRLSEVFFKKANSKKGKRMIEDLKNADK